VSQLHTARIALCYARVALSFAPTDFDKAVARMHLRHAIKRVESALPAKADGSLFFRKQAE
jgi:hypothetical protein